MPINIEKLKQAKKEKGLSYDDLAKITGYSRSTITNIFCGYIELPRHDTVQAIERALGLAPTFTEEEIAQGVGNHPNVLSDRDLNTLGIINHAEDILGYEYVDKFLTLLELTANQKEKNQK